MTQIQEVAEAEQKMDMTPMIDVTFLLLIFFLCTIKFKTLEGKLSAYLPKQVGMGNFKTEPKPKIEIKIRVVNPGTKLDAKGEGPWDLSSEGRFTFGPDRQLEYQIDSKRYATVEEVRKRLLDLKLSATPDTSVAIDPRKDTDYQDVVLVVDAVLDAKFDNVSFVGSYEK